MNLSRLLTFIALRGVPLHLRASVEGDLLERGGGAHEALAIAWHFQTEPYRAGVDRRSALLLLIAAAGVLWTVPMAAQSLLAQASMFSDPWTRTALQVWSAPQVLAAVACGLLLGRVSLLASHAEAARVHIVLLLMPIAAMAAPGVLQATLAAGLLPAATWFAYRARQSAPNLAAQV